MHPSLPFHLPFASAEGLVCLKAKNQRRRAGFPSGFSPLHSPADTDCPLSTRLLPSPTRPEDFYPDCGLLSQGDEGCSQRTYGTEVDGVLAEFIASLHGSSGSHVVLRGFEQRVVLDHINRSPHCIVV